MAAAAGGQQAGAAAPAAAAPGGGAHPRSPLHTALDAIDRGTLARRELPYAGRLELPENYRRHPFEFIDSRALLWRIMFRFEKGALVQTNVDPGASTLRSGTVPAVPAVPRTPRCCRAPAEFISSFGARANLPDIGDGEDCGLGTKAANAGRAKGNKTVKAPAIWSASHEAWSATTTAAARTAQLDAAGKKKEMLSASACTYEIQPEIMGREMKSWQYKKHEGTMVNAQFRDAEVLEVVRDAEVPDHLRPVLGDVKIDSVNLISPCFRSVRREAWWTRSFSSP